jgi:membrane-bound lytic murein transglycosylase MltF
MRRARRVGVAVLAMLWAGVWSPAAAIDSEPPASAPPPSEAPAAQASPSDPAATEPEAAVGEDDGAIEAQEALIAAALEPWTGDLDGMIERRQIRILTASSKTFYFIDRGRQRGATYEFAKKFEDELNRKLKLGAIRVHVVVIPVSRDRLLPGLLEGIGDIAAANLTVTEERQSLVDFADPVAVGISEVVVTGPDSPPLASTDDLAGREVVVRRSSSYYDSLVALNERLRGEGKPEIQISLADENLEDEDLLEMVNAGLYPAIVVDAHKARFWQEIFAAVKVHENVAVRTGGAIAWAIRKDSPKLAAAINDYVKGHKIGTEFGNIILKRYLKDTKYITSALGPKDQERFNQTVELFKKYAGDYGFDWLMIAAQAYQESGIDQSVRSRAGAVGVMQVLPKTAAGSPINIKSVDKSIENNIHAGVKYLRFMANEYFDDPAISAVDRHLFAFAGYNAGPNRVDRLRRKAAEQGLDPNSWFGNVEVVVARHVGRETVQYVGNIFKYYVAYKRLAGQAEARRDAVGKARN